MWKQIGLTLLVAGLSAATVFGQDATAVPASDAASQSQTTVTGGDDISLLAFIQRYLVGSQPGVSVDVRIGTADANLPFALTAPSDAILYGTVARHGGQAGEGTYYDIAYDTAQTPTEIIEFYKQAYSGADWKLTSESVSPPAAFSGQSNSYSTFCYQDGAATLNVNAFNAGTGPTNLNITVQVPGDAYVCSSTQQGAVTDPMYAMIPSLALPEGVTVVSNMGGGLSYYTSTGRSTNVSAILDSSRPLADIANDYNAQLAAQNWQQVSTESSEHTALSTWTVTDATGKVWHGTLLIVAEVTPNRYDAVIYVQE